MPVIPALQRQRWCVLKSEGSLGSVDKGTCCKQTYMVKREKLTATHVLVPEDNLGWHKTTHSPTFQVPVRVARTCSVGNRFCDAESRLHSFM